MLHMDEISRLFLGQELFLLLRSQIESCFNSPSTNHEYFRMPLVVREGNHLALHQGLDNHFSIQLKGDIFIGSGPNSFIYYPVDNLWVNGRPAANNETIRAERNEIRKNYNYKIGSMSVYKEWSIIAKDSSEERLEISLLNKSRLEQSTVSAISSSISKCQLMRLIMKTSEGQEISASIELPMVNDDGEYRLSIRPFLAQPWSLARSLSLTTSSLKEITKAYDAENGHLMNKALFSWKYERVKHVYLSGGDKPIVSQGMNNTPLGLVPTRCVLVPEPRQSAVHFFYEVFKDGEAPIWNYKTLALSQCTLII